MVIFDEKLTSCYSTNYFNSHTSAVVWSCSVNGDNSLRGPPLVLGFVVSRFLDTIESFPTFAVFHRLCAALSSLQWFDWFFATQRK